MDGEKRLSKKNTPALIKDFKKLILLVLSLFLGVAVTVFSIWYNFQKPENKTTTDLLDLISKRLEATFDPTANQVISNR